MPTIQFVDSDDPPSYLAGTMAISLDAIPTVQPNMEPLLRSLGKLIITSLDTEPARAYTPQEIFPVVMERAGMPRDLQLMVQGANLALDIAGLFSPGTAELNGDRKGFWEAILNTLIDDGKLTPVVHNGVIYLRVAPTSESRGLLDSGM